MNIETIEILSRKFEVVKEREGPGKKMFKYIPTKAVVQRLNEAFGCEWSSRAESEQIIDDEVVIRIRLSVTSDSSKEVVIHDGYASHPIFRYTYGDNIGKTINIGNSFRSASSKALKAAATKFGVGLDIEEEDALHTSMEPTNAGLNLPPFGVPSGSPKTTPPIPAASVQDTKKDLPLPFPTFNGGYKEQPKAVPVEAEPQSGISNTNLPPFFGAQSSLSEDVIKEGSKTMPFNEIPIFGNEGTDLATEVQKVAIGTIMKRLNFTFDTLASIVLERADNLPKLEALPYSDAVKIIQSGNKL